MEQVLIISVNAATHHYPGWDREPEPPNIRKVLGSVTDVLMSRYTNDTKHIVRTACEHWSESQAREGTRVQFEFVEVSFGQDLDPVGV